MDDAFELFCLNVCEEKQCHIVWLPIAQNHRWLQLCLFGATTLILFHALRYNPIHPSIGYYHLSAVNHTSPVVVYIITFSPPRQLLSMNVILCVAYCIKTVLDHRISIAASNSSISSRLFFQYFYY